jgi:hypothetical protein
MPLQEIQTMPTESPSATILFHGLLLWYPDEDGTSCRIGVLRSAPGHHLSIEVRIKKQGEPDFTIMRYQGPMRFLTSDDNTKTNPGLLITVSDPSDDARVSAFAPEEDFERSPNSHSDPRDYRWGVDLDNVHKDEIDHTQNSDELLVRDDNCTEPSIKITQGILYTASRSHPDVKIEKVVLKDTSQREDFYPIAALMGINIYLDPDPEKNQQLVLQWLKEDGSFKELPLPAHDKAGELSYEIYIDNNPTYTDDISHSDFTEFYKAFQLRSLPNTLFDLVFTIPPALQSGSNRTMKFVERGTDLGTPTIPCMPGGNGGH